MKLIVDSGSTKTHVRVIDGNIYNREYHFRGINPYYQNEDGIYEELKRSLDGLRDVDVREVYHYGAGCSFPEKKEVVRAAWKKLFPNSTVEVDTDMLGAARSLLGNKSGIACILGTGANSCYCENGQILQNVPPLGFILGDEGSGAYLGAKLVANCLKGFYNKEFIERFFNECNCDSQKIMDAVYKEEYPNRYLASFVPFISKNIEMQEMNELVNNAFSEFFERNVLAYHKPDALLGFVGGVACQFAPILEGVAKRFGYYAIKVVSDPLDGLIAYHNGQKV